MAFDKEAIFAAPLPSKTVKAWGQEITVRAPSGRDRLEMLDVVVENQRAVEDYEADQARDEEAREGFPLVERYSESTIEIIYACYDADGKRIFSMEDYDRMRDLDYATMRLIYNEIVALRTPEVDIEALKKTLLLMENDASSSD